MLTNSHSLREVSRDVYSIYSSRLGICLPFLIRQHALAATTEADGIAEVQGRLGPYELKSVQLQKDGYDLFKDSRQPGSIVTNGKTVPNKYSLRPIILDATDISFIAIDQSGLRVEDVQIYVDGSPPATTNANGEAAIRVYRPLNTDIILEVVYQYKARQIEKETVLGTLAGGRFSISKPGFATATVDPAGRVRGRVTLNLPIPAEVSLRVMVQDQHDRPLEGMTIRVNDQDYDQTDANGFSIFHIRISIDENTLSGFRFQKYGQTYPPQGKSEFWPIGQNKHLGGVTLEIPYRQIDIVAETEVAGQKIGLNVVAEISLDDEEAKVRRLPASIPAFPGVRRLSIEIAGIPWYNKQLRIGQTETVPIPLTLLAPTAWRACMLSLNEKPNDLLVLQSADELAKALGREDFFRRWRERLQ